MYSKSFFAASALLSVAAAVPMAKRDIVWVTDIVDDIVTVPVTKTVWLEPGETAPSEYHHKGHHKGHHSHHSFTWQPESTTTVSAAPISSEESSAAASSSYVAPSSSEESSSAAPSTYVAPSSSSVYVAPTSSSSSVYVAPTTSSVYVAPTTSSTSVYVAPTTSSTSVYVAPTTSSSSVYVAPTTSSTYVEPTSTYVAPSSTYVAPTSTYVAPSSTYVASSSTVAAPAAYSSSASGSSGSASWPAAYACASPIPTASVSSGPGAAGTSYTGDMTWYDTGLGACGCTNTASNAIVAISETLFDSYDAEAAGNPNMNPMCGKWVSITGVDGSEYSAQVVDRCTGCDEGSLDLTEDFFNTVTSNGDGRVHNISWKFI